MYRYGEFETLLTAALGISQAYQATFRHRLKYYRRLGMFEDVKGERNVVYKFDDLLHWSFMLAIAQFGIDPQRMVKISQTIWPSLMHIVSDPANHNHDDDLMFVARPLVLSASILEDDKTFTARVSGLRSVDDKGFRFTCFRSTIQDWASENLMVINLSFLYRRALAAEEKHNVNM